MRHFPSVLTSTESDLLADRIEAHFAANGWGLWAVEVRDVAPFIGFVGLAPADRVLGRPCIEVGWRLSSSHWGHGYAPEGARACLSFAFDDLELDEIVSFTVPGNLQSRRVMEKIGLELVEEFDHPGLPVGDPLRRHVLYATGRDDWLALAGSGYPAVT
jgi:RimJ/RimL family protein N-acetyltransferase